MAASPFKSMVERDIHAVFLNLREFANEHWVNGVKLSCVIDIDKRAEMSARSQKEYPEGLVQQYRRLWVKKSDLGWVPNRGATINVDDVAYYVADNQEDDGMLILRLRTTDVY